MPDNSNESGKNRVQEPGKVSRPPWRPKSYRPRVFLKREQVGTEEQKGEREKDINYFKRRFEETELRCLESNAAEIEFTYTVTDPDWVCIS